MKSVLISVRPQWCAKIANREKTLEIRKNKPKIPTPFKCYIYCTLPPTAELFSHGEIREYANELIRLQDGKILYSYGMQLVCDDRPYTKDNFLCQKVIGEFVCDYIPTMQNVITGEWFPDMLTAACLTPSELDAYSGGKTLYGWHISDLQIYDKPRELSELKRIVSSGRWERPVRIERPPQSWCYVEVLS